MADQKPAGKKPSGKKPFNKKQLACIFGFAAVTTAATYGPTHFPYRDPEGAKATIEKTTTLKDVQIKDERAWYGGCGEGDMFKTKFSGVNDKGEKVNGIVCRGLLKNSTIRYE